MQHAGTDARAGRCVPGYTITRCDIRVGPMIHIEYRTLCALKQKIGTISMGVIELARYISQHGLEQLWVPHPFCINHIELNLAALDIRLECTTKREGARAQIGR